jgi:serine/threonine protein kinase
MGTILPGRFEPIRLLRKDRGCSTFVATDRGLGRNEVVVKLIGKGYFTSDTDALVDVFSWYRGLRHVFISEVLDAGVTAKRELFYVRPYHPPSEFFTTSDTDSLKALVSAVDFLHSMGRAHGSIKPSNVFAGRGRLRIADPSVYRNRTDPRRSLTEEDIRFSAPEVLSGGEISVDGDLYSLGALLYRFFSGRDPFEDSDLESLKAKYIWASPRSLGSVSHVSKVMGDIVTTLLDKDPRVRIAAFESLKEELDIAATPAVRAPAVGRREDVEKALTQLMEKSRLSMVLVEGPEGTGKSRFVEELQNRASLGGHLLVACDTKAQDPLMDLARKAVSVVDERGLGAGAASLSRLRRFASE